MRVVEEQTKGTFARAMLAHVFDEFAAVPFVDDDQVRAVHRLVEIERFIVKTTFEQWIRSTEFLDRRGTMLRDQVGATPGLPRLVNDHLVSARDQLTRNA